MTNRPENVYKYVDYDNTYYNKSEVVVTYIVQTMKCLHLLLWTQ